MALTLQQYQEQEARAAYEIALETGHDETSATYAYQEAWLEAERWAKMYPDVLEQEDQNGPLFDD